MKNSLIPLFCLLLCTTCMAGPGYQIRTADKIRIKEAITISKKFGDNIWPGINAVPFAMVLVTDSIEFLINHTNPPSDFIFLNNDTDLATAIYYRKRQYPAGWLATFPVNGINCIVAGTPENTGLSSTAWIITLLHEHFHQYQYSQPGYYTAVEKLGLSGGDQTGMWMLNYPFPYEQEKIVGLYKEYVSELIKALTGIPSKEIKKNAKKLKECRQKWMQALSRADHKYLSFQLWQEGIARYTEYKFLELLVAYDPSDEVMRLEDFISFREYKEKFFRAQQEELKNLQLNKDKRVCFYGIGFAEGLLLDKLDPGWRLSYLSNRFYIGEYSTKP